MQPRTSSLRISGRTSCSLLGSELSSLDIGLDKKTAGQGRFWTPKFTGISGEETFLNDKVTGLRPFLV